MVKLTLFTCTCKSTEAIRKSKLVRHEGPKSLAEQNAMPRKMIKIQRTKKSNKNNAVTSNWENTRKNRGRTRTHFGAWIVGTTSLSPRNRDTVIRLQWKPLHNPKEQRTYPLPVLLWQKDQTPASHHGSSAFVCVFCVCVRVRFRTFPAADAAIRTAVYVRLN